MAKRKKSDRPTTTEVDTGIYATRTIGARAGTHTEAAAKQVITAAFAAFAGLPDVPTMLANIEAAATSIRAKRADVPAIVKEADGALFRVAELREALESKSKNAVAYQGIMLGTVFERLIVRHNAEHHAKHGKESSRGLGKARDSKAGNAAQRKQEIIAALRQRLQDHPRDSVTYARGQIAKQYKDTGGRPLPGYSLAQIKRCTKGIKKKKNQVGALCTE
jgi:hypothetical protein